MEKIEDLAKSSTDSDHQFLLLFSGRVVETDMAEVWRRYIRPLQFSISIQFSQPANTRGLFILAKWELPQIDLTLRLQLSHDLRGAMHISTYELLAHLHAHHWGQSDH